MNHCSAGIFPFSMSLALLLVFLAFQQPSQARPSSIKNKMGNLTATPMELNPLARLPPVEMLSRQSSKLCLSHGGLCVADGQCPAGQLTEKADTCEQAGTICCHALPLTVTDCAERGGFCGSSRECGRAPREPLGHCPHGQFCCVLIN